jgi:predicted Zn-dependent protease with MMP-like domain
MNPHRFQRLVAKALRELPPQFRARIENVEVLIEDEPDPRLLAEVGVPAGGSLLGLYQGIPLTERTTAYSMVLPDRLTIFRKPIEQACASDWEIRHQVRKTVVHEVAHYFGISDRQLHEWGVH